MFNGFVIVMVYVVELLQKKSGKKLT